MGQTLVYRVSKRLLKSRRLHLQANNHVFPLRATPGGVLMRAGHTEGSVDLASMAGLSPSAVLCELMNPDGTMMRGEAIEEFAQLHSMPILTIAELIEWRQRS